MIDIKISDSLQQIKFTIEDLQAVQTVVMAVEDHPVYSNDHEALIVVRRVLDPIINDLKEATKVIEGELKNVQQD